MERREQERDLTTEDIAGSSPPANETAGPAGPQSPIDGSSGPQSPAEAQRAYGQGQSAPQAPIAPQDGREQRQGMPPQKAVGTREDAGAPTEAMSPVERSPQSEAETSSQPLLATGDADEFHRRWESIQIGFVDEPRRAVEDADKLVAEVIRRLAETFSEERSRLEGQWGRGEAVPTDDLRLTLQRYRSFFHRLLST